jgi:hypothetical protein
MRRDEAVTDPDALSEEQQEALALVVQAERLPAILDAATLETAALYRRLAKDLIERIQEKWKPIKARERAVWQASVDDEKRDLEGPTALFTTLNKRIADFETRQLAAQRVAEQRAAEEARVIAEVARRDGVALPPLVVPAVVVPTAKVAGLGFSLHYKAEVVDAAALVQGVAKGKVTSAAVAPVHAVLDDLARQLGPQTAAKDTPGVRVPMPGVAGVVIVSERRTRG